MFRINQIYTLELTYGFYKWYKSYLPPAPITNMSQMRMWFMKGITNPSIVYRLHEKTISLYREISKLKSYCISFVENSLGISLYEPLWSVMTGSCRDDTGRGMSFCSKKYTYLSPLLFETATLVYNSSGTQKLSVSSLKHYPVSYSTKMTV